VLAEDALPYRELFEAMVEGFAVHEIVCDAEGRPVDYVFLEVNPAFERLTGLRRADVIGRRVTEVIPGLEPSWIRTYGEVALGGEPTHFESRSEALGRDYEVVAFSPRRGRFATLFVDVTEHKRALAARRESEERAQALADALRETERRLLAEDRRKSEFLAVLSHELRNPLAPIRTGLHVLERSLPGSPQHERARAVIRRQVDHITRLVDDLLDVTRIAHGKIALQPSRLDLREVVRRACDDARSTFEDRGIALRVDLPSEGLWVDGDPIRLAQVVGNLLHNAAKFTPPGGAVDVVLRRVGPDAEITVRDNGIGIDAEDLERIFEPFEQSDRRKASVAHGGIGLGLALVRSLAELHGGKARAHSEGSGRGAELVVTLPLAPAPERGEGGQAGRPAPRALRVLVVEDSVDAAETLADLLRLEGHEVHLAADGPAGLAAVAALRPDVLVCDVGLPGMSGYEVADTLRARGGERPFTIALTGFAQPDDQRRALAAGFDAHLAKPPPLEQLQALMRHVAETRHPGEDG
jgi:PAS domain S-box-containing protein